MLNEVILTMALDSYRTRLKNDPKYKENAKSALMYLADFAIRNELLDTLAAILLDSEIQEFLEKEKRENAK